MSTNGHADGFGAAALALARLGLAIRGRSEADRNVYDYTFAVHDSVGCDAGGPSRCSVCAVGEWLRHVERAEITRREAVAQHAVSMAKLADLPTGRRARSVAREAALIQRTHAIAGAGARCRVCKTTAAGRSCRSCGTSVATEAEVRAALGVLDALNHKEFDDGST